jgi:hypothetical protein
LYPQQLFYQNTYKGGVCGDGISYNSKDYLWADTIRFANVVPPGTVIKKAFLISYKLIFYAGNHPVKEPAISFKFNNNIISYDSTDNVSPFFHCDFFSSSSGDNWIVSKDVSQYTLPSNNILITADQLPLQDEYGYAGFYLLIMYEDITLPKTNVAVYVNNQSYSNNMLQNINGLNLINNATDVGLAIWAENVSAQDIPYFCI